MSLILTTPERRKGRLPLLPGRYLNALRELSASLIQTCDSIFARFSAMKEAIMISSDDEEEDSDEDDLETTPAPRKGRPRVR